MKVIPASAAARAIRILREEAVTRVDGISAGFFGDANNLLNIEVGTDGMALFTNRVGLISLLTVNGVAVFVGEDADGLSAELVGRTVSADCDFAAVSDQNL